MEQAPQEQIEAIVRSLEAKGVPAAPVLEATALATSHPEAVGDLAIAVMRRFPKGGTFLDGALSFLPQEAWPELVWFALDTLERSGGKNAAAESVIEYASLQCPSALHPHLDRIFVVRPNARCYYEPYPWRESGDRHLGFLRTVIQTTTSMDEDRTRAWTDLCETRHAEAVEYALSCADHVSPPRLVAGTMGPSPPSSRRASPGEPVHTTPLPCLPSSPSIPGIVLRAGNPSPVARTGTPDLEVAVVHPARLVRRHR